MSKDSVVRALQRRYNRVDEVRRGQTLTGPQGVGRAAFQLDPREGFWLVEARVDAPLTGAPLRAVVEYGLDGATSPNPQRSPLIFDVATRARVCVPATGIVAGSELGDAGDVAPASASTQTITWNAWPLTAWAPSELTLTAPVVQGIANTPVELPIDAPPGVYGAQLHVWGGAVVAGSTVIVEQFASELSDSPPQVGSQLYTVGETSVVPVAPATRTVKLTPSVNAHLALVFLFRA